MVVYMDGLLQLILKPSAWTLEQRMNFCPTATPAFRQHTLVAAILGSLFLSGCSLQPPLPPQMETQAAIEEPDIAEPEIPSRPFEAETLYALLVAEMAGSRERYDIALGNYMQQAHKTQDPGVTARATRIARFLNARQAALNGALLWIQLDPENNEARFTAASELAQSGRLLEATDQSEYLLTHGSTPIFQSIAAQAARSTDTQREQLVQRYQELLEQHPDNTQLLVGLGLLKQQQKDLEVALDYARKALEVDDALIPAAVLEAKLLHQLQRTDEALDRLAQLLSKHPDNKRLRLQYARVLASFDLEKAQQQFAMLVEKNPNDPELIFSLALISNERGMLDEAKQHFEKLISLDSRRSSAHYYLGRIAEKENNLNAALEHYIKVEPGPDFMPALLQTTDILISQDEISAANKRLHAARQRFPSQAERFYLLESEVLSKHRHLEEAEDVLSQGIEQFPASTQLLYGRAMINEQLDLINLTESDLRTILKYDPNNATALNALGYTLADRTDRFEEAYELISQALHIKPDDPAIIDSMGWVQYRLGRLDEAVLRLRQAMQMFPDHEIAAHLGEVLWVSGEQSEARNVWQEGLKLNPDSTIIPSVIERITGEPSSPDATSPAATPESSSEQNTNKEEVADQQ
jgi:tetratricopeptide (TPR) repeat protein